MKRTKTEHAGESRGQPLRNLPSPVADDIVRPMTAPSNSPVFTWDWFTADSAGFFTSIAAVIACLQAGLFVWQLVYMRKSMEHATIASTAAQESAKVAREAFTKMERPYLYIFGIKGLLSDLGEEPITFLHFSIANYGKTPAKIERVLYSCALREENLEPLPGFQWDPLLRNTLLIPGEVRNEIEYLIPETIPTRQYVDEDSPPSDWMEPVLKSDEVFLFLVKVTYSGPFSEGHETSACWSWSKRGGLLVEYHDPALNYTR